MDDQTSSRCHPHERFPPGPTGSGARTRGGASFDWDAFAPRIVHPLKVAIIEALLWIGRPLSLSELERTFLGCYRLPVIKYHVGTIVECGAIEEVGRRGQAESLYFLSAGALRRSSDALTTP